LRKIAGFLPVIFIQQPFVHESHAFFTVLFVEFKEVGYQSILRSGMAKYGAKAKNKVGQALHEQKRGRLKMGKSGKKVKSRKQAIAIGLSQARRAGGKVPSRKKRTRT
jgi:hypothetical protein